ncbi:putative Chitin binding Peritrophin-A domain-containing protein 7 [Homarus americanus]|uniref:Putative Chitin binding Peritrophin-A domain-containing protein 7 n=1 Tax=Homarus americanus TaxID=6706 RepID=A0A8J5JGG3_HOMAM|nr:putative Chitin binding Peritrophin-A domain-containing protein 7 [Homarus americanus]
MLSRLFAVGVLVGVLGVTVVLSAIPGPNDARYPDYIVDPKVKCEKEGSFPHPRNCSWYYRCVDRMHVGMYWTYYFECEPGTVFSDELDQCVHPFLADPPCGKPITTPEPTLECKGVPGTCTFYDVCRPVRRKIHLCGKVQCPLRSPFLQCAPGSFFNMNDRECVKPPRPEDLCGSVTKTNITITEIGELACSYDNIRPSSDIILKLHCEKYALCEAGKYVGTKQLCKKYFECYMQDNVWKYHQRFCPVGLLYSYEHDKCDYVPTGECLE